MSIPILGQRILLRRRDKRLTQAELGKHVGISSNTIARIERGRIQDLGGSIIAKVAEALDTSTDYLLGLTDDDTPK